MLFTADGEVMAFGTPGGDVQAQAMLQLLLNLVRVRHEPAAGRRGAPLRDSVVPGLVLAPPLLPGPRHPRGPHRPRRRPRRSAPAATRCSAGATGSGGRAACAWRGWTRMASGGARRIPGATPRRWPGERRAASRLASPDAADARRPRPQRASRAEGRILTVLLAVTGCAVETPRPVVMPPPARRSGPVALVPPPILSRFGEWRGEGGAARPARHAGIDIRAATGTPVLAAADGLVLRTGSQVFAGRLVVVAHDTDRTTVYYHLSAVEVVPGQAVRRGEVDRTGRGERERDGAASALRAVPARGRPVRRADRRRLAGSDSALDRRQPLLRAGAGVPAPERAASPTRCRASPRRRRASPSSGARRALGARAPLPPA